MSNVISIKQFKKEKARKEKEKNAQNNRILFGTPKSLKDTAKKQNLLDQKRLEKLKLDQEKLDKGDE